MEGYSFGQLFSLCTVTSHFTLAVFCSFIIALFLHIFHILNIILYYIPAICNFICMENILLILLSGGANVRLLFLSGGANVRPSLFKEGQMSYPLVLGRGKCPGEGGGKYPWANVLYSYFLILTSGPNESE